MHIISKKSLISSILVLVSISELSAASDKGFYGQFEAGYSKNSGYRTYSSARKYVNGSGSYAPIFGGEIGYAVGNNFRLGLAAYRASYNFKNYSERWDTYYEDGYTANSFINGKVKIQNTAFMLNGYYDFSGFEHFIPYISAGAGISLNKSSDIDGVVKRYNTVDDGETFEPDSYAIKVKGKNRVSFAWNVGAGLKVPVNDKLSLNMAIRYIDYGNTATSKIFSMDGSTGYENSSSGTKIKAFATTIGLVYKF